MYENNKFNCHGRLFLSEERFKEMSYAITHFSIGVICAAVGVYVWNKEQSEFILLYLFGGGLFAMMPDSTKLFSGTIPLFQTSLTNIFFFHQFLDTVIDPSDSIIFASVAVFCMLVSVVLLTISSRIKRKTTN